MDFLTSLDHLESGRLDEALTLLERLRETIPLTLELPMIIILTAFAWLAQFIPPAGAPPPRWVAALAIIFTIAVWAEVVRRTS